MNPSINADDIYSLMGAVQRYRNDPFYTSSDHDLSITRTSPYYEPSLMLSEYSTNNNNDHPSSYSSPRRPPSSHYSYSDVSISAESNPSSVWDLESTHWTTSSVSSAPSRPSRHYQPQHVQPPQMQHHPYPPPHPPHPHTHTHTHTDPSHILPYPSHTSPSSSSSTTLTLPCEFVGYVGCEATFGVDQPMEWINHIVSVHLRSVFPDHTICWFCDDETFVAASRAIDHRRQAYYARMRHIAGHIVSGRKTVKDMRPDHFFLDHLHDNGLIDEQTFRKAISYHELKLPKGSNFTLNTVPPPNPAADRGQVIVERRRGKRAGLQRDPRRVLVNE